MTSISLKLTAAAALIAASGSMALAGSAATSEGYNPTDSGQRAADFDQNKDGNVDSKEFYAAYDNEPVWVIYDANADGSIDREEFNAGFYKQFDRDQDGNWNSDEQQAFDNLTGRGVGESISQ